MKNLALLALAFSSLPVYAAEVGPCMGLEEEASLVVQSKVFAQGTIRVSHVDTDGEPVCCSSHLMILVKNGAQKQCFLVSQKAGNMDSFPQGWVGIDMDKLSARYEAGKGLLLSVPVSLYDFENGGESKPGGVVKMLVNRANGTKVTIEN